MCLPNFYNLDILILNAQQLQQNTRIGIQLPKARLLLGKTKDITDLEEVFNTIINCNTFQS